MLNIKNLFVQKKRKNMFGNSMYTCIVDSLCCIPEAGVNYIDG